MECMPIPDPDFSAHDQEIGEPGDGINRANAKRALTRLTGKGSIRSAY